MQNKIMQKKAMEKALEKSMKKSMEKDAGKRGTEKSGGLLTSGRGMVLRYAAAVLLTELLTVGGGMQALAGSWQQNDTGWWFQQEDGSYPAAQWVWLDGNGDGVYECYCFDAAGYLYMNTQTPDGFSVDENGIWMDHGISVSRRFVGEVPAPVSISGETSSGTQQSGSIGSYASTSGGGTMLLGKPAVSRKTGSGTGSSTSETSSSSGGTSSDSEKTTVTVSNSGKTSTSSSSSLGSLGKPAAKKKTDATTGTTGNASSSSSGTSAGSGSSSASSTGTTEKTVPVVSGTHVADDPNGPSGDRTRTTSSYTPQTDNSRSAAAPSGESASGVMERDGEETP